MNGIAPSIDWGLAIALAGLLALAVVAALAGRLGTARSSVVAAVRAVAQLLVVAGVIDAALAQVWSAVVFVSFMLVVAAITSAGRVGARHDGLWIGSALACGVLPVTLLIFDTGSTPTSPPSIVAICGIVIGGSMTACSLALRRAFSSLQGGFGQVEAALALGFARPHALRLVIDPDRAEALVPVLDQTRTVGLVTLPGAFVGVLLGGGSPTQAAAAQMLVLVGLVAAEAITVVIATRLVASGRVLSPDLRERLPPG